MKTLTIKFKNQEGLDNFYDFLENFGISNENGDEIDFINNIIIISNEDTV